MKNVIAQNEADDDYHQENRNTQLLSHCVTSLAEHRP
jgi:hypothetical protein